jgi:large subunit ribosomal protein L22e/Meckel syndrome type 1 protein
MNRLILAAALAAGCTLASSAPALAARNYDCSKPGNANKAACKAVQAPKKADAAKPSKEEKAKPKKEEKAAAAARPTATASTERHYDCSKAGNLNKAACKGASATIAAAQSKPAPKSVSHPAAMPKAASAPKATRAVASNENNNPAGAIAQCKDGTYSHSKVHSGACSKHGGVGKWMG